MTKDYDLKNDPHIHLEKDDDFEKLLSGSKI